MDKYRRYTIEQWIWDESFREWVLNPTAESNRLWHQWLAENHDKWSIVQRASAVIRSVKVVEEPISDVEIKDIVQKTLQKIDKKSSENFNQILSEAEPEVEEAVIVPIYNRLWFKVAAAITVLVVVGGWWFKSSLGTSNQDEYAKALSANAPELIETINKTDKPQTVRLSDGSIVTLKKGSRISYQSTFEGNSRIVYLSGEAFFDIAKNPSKPFLVYANELVTKVLGTSFLVKAYQFDKEVTVEVRTGKVSVFSQKDPEMKEKTTSHELNGVILTPNQKIVFNRTGDQMAKKLVADPIIVLSDREMRNINFDFEDTPANEVFAVLKKAYNIDIMFDESLLKDCPVTASLTDQPLFEKLKIICKAIEANYEILDGNILIQSKGCKG